MGISKEYRDHVADLFSTFGEVQVRPMFGGAGIYHDGIMFGLVTAEEGIYLKADDASKARFEAEDMGPFTYHAPKGNRPPIVMAYWQIPLRLLDDVDEMADWARIAFDVARRTHKPKAAKRRKPGKSSKSK